MGERRVLGAYVARNAMLPQVTVLALQIGLMFNGSLVCEILFAYPGLGRLLYSAVIQGDFNLLMGTVALSIVVGRHCDAGDRPAIPVDRSARALPLMRRYPRLPARLWG